MIEKVAVGVFGFVAGTLVGAKMYDTGVKVNHPDIHRELMRRQGYDVKEPKEVDIE